MNRYAFPSSAPIRKAEDGSVLETEHGMTQWDYYAGKALAGMLASEGLGSEEYYPEKVAADRAGRMADAMMAERERRGIGK